MYVWLCSHPSPCSNNLACADKRPPCETITVRSPDKLSLTPNNIHVNIGGATLNILYTCFQSWSQLFPAVDMLCEICYVFVFSASLRKLAPVSMELCKREHLTICPMFDVCFLSENSVAWLFLIHLNPRPTNFCFTSLITIIQDWLSFRHYIRYNW